MDHSTHVLLAIFVSHEELQVVEQETPQATTPWIRALQVLIVQKPSEINPASNPLPHRHRDRTGGRTRREDTNRPDKARSAPAQTLALHASEPWSPGSISLGKNCGENPTSLSVGANLHPRRHLMQEGLPGNIDSNRLSINCASLVRHRCLPFGQ